MGSRNRFGRKKKEEGSFNKWRRKRGEAKNRSQLKRYTDRLEALRKIKNPNDWQKNQIANAVRLKNQAATGLGKRGMQDDQGDKGKGPESNRVGSTPNKKTWPQGNTNKSKPSTNQTSSSSNQPSSASKDPVWDSKTFQWKVPANVEANKAWRKKQQSGNGGDPPKKSTNLQVKKPSGGGAKEKKKDDWKPTSIQKKLMRGGWSKEELQAKQAKHKQWKADRKAGKLKTKKFDPRAGRR